MLEMVDKYTSDFPKHVGKRPLPAEDVVLVTGTTGALGAKMLARLVQMQDVGHIYAMNRKVYGDKTLESRQAERLKEWGLDPEILNSKKVTLIETDMAAKHFGLSDEFYEQVRFCPSISSETQW